MVSDYDTQSGTTVSLGVRIAIGTASVTNGSNVATWASGVKFSIVWQFPNQIKINGVLVQIATGTTPTNCTTHVAMSCTTLTMTANWAGSTGTYAYTSNATGSIYGADASFYNAATNTWKFAPSWGNLISMCTGDQPLWGLPEARQSPMTAIDTKRHRFYISNGVNGDCLVGNLVTNGTTTVTTHGGQYFTLAPGLWTGASAQIQIPEHTGPLFTIASVDTETSITIVCGGAAPACPNGSTDGTVIFADMDPNNPSGPYDLWYLSLNADPTTDTWTQVQTGPTNDPQPDRQATFAYDSDDDCIIALGNGANIGNHHFTWVFATADGNPGGVLSASQTACGVTAADKFNEILSGGSPITAPPNFNYPTIKYDATRHAVWAMGGCSSNPMPISCAADTTDVYKYCPTSLGIPCGAAKTWTAQNSANQPPHYVSGYQYTAPIALYPPTGALIYHYLDGPATYIWSPSTNAWTTLLASGGASTPVCMYPSGTQNGCVSIMLSYDPGIGALIVTQQQSVSNVFQGLLSLTGSTVSLTIR